MDTSNESPLNRWLKIMVTYWNLIEPEPEMRFATVFYMILQSNSVYYLVDIGSVLIISIYQENIKQRCEIHPARIMLSISNLVLWIKTIFVIIKCRTDIVFHSSRAVIWNPDKRWSVSKIMKSTIEYACVFVVGCFFHIEILGTACDAFTASGLIYDCPCTET